MPSIIYLFEKMKVWNAQHLEIWCCFRASTTKALGLDAGAFSLIAGYISVSDAFIE